MKSIISYSILFLSLAVTLSCQQEVNDLNTKAELNAERFLAPPEISPENLVIFSTGDHLSPAITRGNPDVLKIRFNNRTAPWQEGISALMEYTQTKIPANLSAADQQYLLEGATYATIDFFDRAPTASPEKSRQAALFLAKVIESGDPIDWHALTRLFNHAEPALEKAQRKSFRSYILRGSRDVLSKDSIDGIPESRHKTNQWQASYAIEQLTSGPASKS